MKNVFYFNHINTIGGVESFFYYIAKKYKARDIEIVYKTSADEKQIKRLSKFVRVRKFDGKKIKCDKAFFNYNIDIIDYIEAEEYIQIIHCDYVERGQAPKTHDKINRYIAVSEWAGKRFTEVTGKECEVCYNPIVIDKPKKVLNLISATRLTIEKGKERIEKFAKLLEKADIPYIWTIYTNDTNAIDNPNIIYRKPNLDIINYIANADYLVQLSDTEAYCYSVVEALSVGTPVIVTDCPVYKEIGLNENNSLIVDFDLKNVDVEKIYKGLPKFVYKPKGDKWAKILAQGESTYQKDLKTLVKVKPIAHYYDLERQEEMTRESKPFKTNIVRAEYLVSLGYVEIV